MIFANGTLPDRGKARRLLDGNETVICADGGTHHALAIGLTPAAVIGDLDSLTQADRLKLEGAGVDITPHPRDKDETDLELALRQAVALKPAAILIMGALGKRLDQTLGNIALLSDPELSQIDCRLDDGFEEAVFCRSVCEIRGAPSDLVSLIPWGSIAEGVRTDGLRWRLNGEDLQPQKTRGISNEMLTASATIRIDAGLLLIVHRRLS